jgi:hypothetical protein
VEDWELVSDDGLVLGVDVKATSTASDVYTWSDDNEVAPPLSPGITVGSPRQVETPRGLTAESGTDQLYLNADGTVVSRVRLSWEAPQSRFMTSGGRAIIMQRESLEWRTFTVDTSEDCFIDTAHGVNAGAWIVLNVEGSNTLPSGLDREYYWVASVTADRFLVSEFPGGPFVDITSAGTGTHEYTILPSWKDVATISGGANEYFALDVEDGKTYDFAVRYVNSIGREGWFTEVSRHTVVGKTAAPGAPTGVTITENATNVSLTWTDPTDQDLSHILIYVKTYQKALVTGSFALNPQNPTYKIPAGQEELILTPDIIKNICANCQKMEFNIKAVDTTGNESTGTDYTNSGSGYIWDLPPEPTITASWVRGTVSSVNTTTDELTITSHPFAEGDPVVHYATTTAIGGVAEDEIYYVRNIDSNTIALADSPGGSYISLTSAGSGTRYIGYVSVQLPEYPSDDWKEISLRTWTSDTRKCTYPLNTEKNVKFPYAGPSTQLSLVTLTAISGASTVNTGTGYAVTIA